MKTSGVISKTKANKRLVLIFLILVSCGTGICIEAGDMYRLLKNEEINASLKMNRLYDFFLPKKQELQSLVSGSKKIGFYTDVLIPQDKEVVLYTFIYLLAPVLLDKNYVHNDAILAVCFLKDYFNWANKQKEFSVLFESDYGFCKLVILKKRK